MDQKKTLHYDINPTWDIIEQISKNIENLLSKRARHIIDATRMVACELIENALKYGKKTGTDNTIKFDLINEQNSIIITVINGISSQTHFENVKNHINKINHSTNPKEIYMQRLLELLNETSKNHTMLGLYRIAYEGEFKLSYKYNNNVIKIIAERSIFDSV